MNLKKSVPHVTIELRDKEEITALWCAIEYYYNLFGSTFSKKTDEFYKKLLWILSLQEETKE